MVRQQISQVQRWDPATYHRNVPHVRELGQRVVELLQPRAGERVLDLGCGEGGLTINLVQMGADVVGVDGSPEFVDAARALGVDAHVLDGQRLTFDAEFDAVFSNAALHWMLDPDAVIAGVRRALRPEGRFVGSIAAIGTAAAAQTALCAVLHRRGINGAARMPWYLPTLKEYRAKLEAHGFRVETIEFLQGLPALPNGMTGWLETFGHTFVQGFEGVERSSIFEEVTELLAPTLRDREDVWHIDAARLLFRATLPRS